MFWLDWFIMCFKWGKQKWTEIGSGCWIEMKKSDKIECSKVYEKDLLFNLTTLNEILLMYSEFFSLNGVVHVEEGWVFFSFFSPAEANWGLSVEWFSAEYLHFIVFTNNKLDQIGGILLESFDCILFLSIFLHVTNGSLHQCLDDTHQCFLVQS